VNTVRAVCLFLILTTVQTASGAEPAAEVYRDDSIAVRAGIPGHPGRIIHFGDVLPLVVDIAYDSGQLIIDEPDDHFFDAAWPDSDRPALIDRKTIRSTDRLRTVFFFQMLDCPGEQWTCPGTREYLLPEFRLSYRNVESAEGAAEAVTFRPWPSILTVSSAIPLDEEDQLFPFKKYFPTNAYPDPVSGSDHRRGAYTFVGIGMAALFGGILMWPFRFKKSSPFAAKSEARWQALLRELEDDDASDEKRYYDSLRRCFVWYCTDELDVDPFEWLSSQDEESDLQRLFVEMLHGPGGKGPEMRARFAEILAQDAGS
jgi:hypothetical protein